MYTGATTRCYRKRMNRSAIRTAISTIAWLRSSTTCSRRRILQEPLRLVRPHVLYEFENPEFEALSSGQKFLLRMGTENAARTKKALAALRDRIT